MKQRIRVVMVEPEYQQNLGYVARVMKNFGLSRLVLVNPRCKHTGKEAIKYSKHAREVLEGARVAKSLKSAARGLTIGTTGIWRKADSSFYNIFNLPELRNRPDWKRSREITLVLGRDGAGLNKVEIRDCDALVFIGTNPEYPVMNISHALAVMLYELTTPTLSKRYNFDDLRADSKYQERLIKLFDISVRRNKAIRDKKAVSGAFRRILKRSVPTKSEINALAVALSPK
ncbi:MAG: RNA methyltransferase [Candidatus Micrarchaeota archaeon]|nr:RNA methyltransferase [Candidatus Micrarchaeota archaeon]